MKKKLIALLIAILIPINVSAEPLLYDTFVQENLLGGHVKVYNGEHQDTVDGSGDKTIYHWFVDSAQEAIEANNKRNVLFAGFCWETLRTTDSGGVKLLYDGPAEDGKCGSSRTTQLSTFYTTTNTLYNSGEFYFADSFTYNASTDYFYLDEDTKTLIDIKTADPEEYKDKYTFTSSNPNSNGWYIYQISDYNSETNKYIVSAYKAKNLSSIGSGALTTYDDLDAIGSIGYMHNKLYYSTSKDMPNWGSYSQPSTPLAETDYTVVNNMTSDPYTFNSSSGKWVWSSTSTSYHIYTSFSFKINNPGNYVLKYNTATKDGGTQIYKNNELIANANNAVDSVVILDNVTTDDVIKIEYDTYSSSNARVPIYVSMEIPNGPSTDTRILLGNSVKYENGKYILVDTIRGDSTTNFKNHHYTCYNTTGECTEVTYLLRYWYSTYYDVFNLKNGQTIESIINDMLYADDVNVIDSPIKTVVDTWFENNMLDYLPYLEDTVFCNNRTMWNEETNYMNPNGGNNTVYFTPTSDSTNEDEIAYLSNLKCSRETDRFAVGNPKAQLKYPVALPNLPEEYILNGKLNHYYANAIRDKRDNYRLMTSQFYGTLHYDWVVQGSGQIYGMYGSDSFAVRPVISLRADTEYTQGDGSPENPYVIREYQKNKINVKNEEEKGTFTIEGVDDPDSILEGTPVTITVEPIEGYVLGKILIRDADDNVVEVTTLDSENKFRFIMPRTEVTIIPVYITLGENTEVTDPTGLTNPETGDYIFAFAIIAALSLPLILHLRKKQQEY